MNNEKILCNNLINWEIGVNVVSQASRYEQAMYFDSNKYLAWKLSSLLRAAPIDPQYVHIFHAGFSCGE